MNIANKNTTFRDVEIESFSFRKKEKYLKAYRFAIMLGILLMSLLASFLWGSFFVQVNDIITGTISESFFTYLPILINKGIISFVSFYFIFKAFNFSENLSHKFKQFWIWILVFFVFSFSALIFNFFFQELQLYLGLIYALAWVAGLLLLNLFFEFYIYKTNENTNPVLSKNSFNKLFAFITYFSIVFFLMGILSKFLNSVDVTKTFDFNNWEFISWLLLVEPIDIFVKILVILAILFLAAPWFYYIFKFIPYPRKNRYISFIFSSVFLLGAIIWFSFAWSSGEINNGVQPNFDEIYSNYMCWIFLAINIIFILVFRSFIFFGKNETKGSLFRTLILTTFISIIWFLLLIINITYDLENKINTFIFIIAVFSTSILFLIFVFQKPKINRTLSFIFTFLLFLVDIAIIINIFFVIFNQFQDALSSLGGINALIYIVVSIVSITSMLIVLFLFYRITRKINKIKIA